MLTVGNAYMRSLHPKKAPVPIAGIRGQEIVARMDVSVKRGVTLKTNLGLLLSFLDQRSGSARLSVETFFLQLLPDDPAELLFIDLPYMGHGKGSDHFQTLGQLKD
jgi:hypothetical protein